MSLPVLIRRIAVTPPSPTSLLLSILVTRWAPAPSPPLSSRLTHSHTHTLSLSSVTLCCWAALLGAAAGAPHGLQSLQLLSVLRVLSFLGRCRELVSTLAFAVTPLLQAPHTSAHKQAHTRTHTRCPGSQALGLEGNRLVRPPPPRGDGRQVDRTPYDLNNLRQGVWRRVDLTPCT